MQNEEWRRNWESRKLKAEILVRGPAGESQEFNGGRIAARASGAWGELEFAIVRAVRRFRREPTPW